MTGKHEDSDIRGRGLDNALNVKDMKLVKWLGANSFRTSHYPYSEELMDLADEMGIAVIDETPAVGLMRFSSNVLQLHKDILTDLVRTPLDNWSRIADKQDTARWTVNLMNKAIK